MIRQFRLQFILRFLSCRRIFVCLHRQIVRSIICIPAFVLAKAQHFSLVKVGSSYFAVLDDEAQSLASDIELSKCQYRTLRRRTFLWTTFAIELCRFHLCYLRVVCHTGLNHLPCNQPRVCGSPGPRYREFENAYKTRRVASNAGRNMQRGRYYFIHTCMIHVTSTNFLRSRRPQTQDCISSPSAAVAAESADAVPAAVCTIFGIPAVMA
jgi:hypothetical protein